MRVRHDFYVKRKAHQLVALEKEAMVLSNKARFITEVLEGSLDLRKKKTSVVSALLKERSYDVIDGDEDYKYLVRLPMDSVTEENIAKIMAEKDRKLAELNQLKTTTESQLWLYELQELKTAYANSIGAKSVGAKSVGAKSVGAKSVGTKNIGAKNIEKKSESSGVKKKKVVKA
jgi:DNA gyrase/topoisomerase IV subunit A